MNENSFVAMLQEQKIFKQQVLEHAAFQPLPYRCPTSLLIIQLKNSELYNKLHRKVLLYMCPLGHVLGINRDLTTTMALARILARATVVTRLTTTLAFALILTLTGMFSGCCTTTMALT